jgi:hypothetical protein
MMKNNIKYIVAGVTLATFAFASCSQFQEEDLFEKSAALRIEQSSAELQDILVNAPQGWVIQYYTGGGVAVFEGFNLFAKFEKNGKVTMAGDHRYLRDGRANKYTEANSLYELVREDGLVLAFNTWNDVLMPFVDPVGYWAAPNILVKDGTGMQGDQNMVVTSMTENEIQFRGERYNAQIRMVKADRDWQTYISDTKATKSLFVNEDDTLSAYYITAGTDTMYCVGLTNGRYRISERIKNPLKVDSVSCCFTPTGFRNERVDTLGGHLFQEFKFNEDSTALVNEDGTVRMVATWDTYLVNRDKVMWMDAESMPENLTSLLADMNTAMKAYNKNYSVTRIGIGKSQTQEGKNSQKGLVLEVKTSRTNRIRAGMALTRSIPAMGKMTITCAEDAKLDNEMNKFNAAVIAAVRAFGAALSGTYQMSPNSNFTPSSVLFQSLDGDTSFMLVSD